MIRFGTSKQYRLLRSLFEVSWKIVGSEALGEVFCVSFIKIKLMCALKQGGSKNLIKRHLPVLFNLAFCCTRLKFVRDEIQPRVYPIFFPVLFTWLRGNVEGSVCWHCVVVSR